GSAVGPPWRLPLLTEATDRAGSRPGADPVTGVSDSPARDVRESGACRAHLKGVNMARSVFYSFHYDRDAWRVQQIINMGAVEGQTILNAQEWEAVKRQGDSAIQKWIKDQMAYKSAVVVLVGAQTANRPWVRYEIAYAWDNY